MQEPQSQNAGTEAAVPLTMNKTNILGWYTGKARTIIETYVLPGLDEAAALGYWPKGMSRKVHAALNKQAVANKFARKNERRRSGMSVAEFDALPKQGLLEDIMDNREKSWESKLEGWNLRHAMEFGSVPRAPECLVLADALAPYCKDDQERAALATARQWAVDFSPVAELLAKLDATRPKPVLLLKTLSNTVLTNVSRAMGIDLTSVTVPEIIYVQRARVVKGETVYDWVPEIKWPEGTAHGYSKHADKVSNCHACGHRIFNPYNWVPLLGYNGAIPMSLWVGRDCAKNIFGCDVTGEAAFRETDATPE